MCRSHYEARPHAVINALTKRRGNLDAIYREASGLAQILNDPLLPVKETLRAPALSRSGFAVERAWTLESETSGAAQETIPISVPRSPSGKARCLERCACQPGRFRSPTGEIWIGTHVQVLNALDH